MATVISLISNHSHPKLWRKKCLNILTNNFTCPLHNWWSLPNWNTKLTDMSDRPTLSMLCYLWKPQMNKQHINYAKQFLISPLILMWFWSAFFGFIYFWFLYQFGKVPGSSRYPHYAQASKCCASPSPAAAIASFFCKLGILTKLTNSLSYPKDCRGFCD